MVKMLLTVLLSALLITFATCSELISVQTSSGKVDGKVAKENGKNFFAFLGIPFAKPPLGDLRFQPPQPLDSSSEKLTVDATKGFSKQCMQPMYSDKDSEDCLYLNVLTPQHDNLGQAKYPVMVWIHGGGFSMGSASQYSEKGTLRNIVSRDVIFVSINYRLGAFGFFTTKSSVASGNYGMLDQVEALRWVQKNIQAFGGDPTKVTIFGESAGGSSVSLLTISPLGKGLFSQAISMSGSAVGTYASMPDEDPLDISNELLKSLNCTPNTTIINSQESCTKDDCQKLGKQQCPYYLKRKNPTAPSVDLNAHRQKLECIQSKTTKEISANNKFLFGWSIRVDDNFLHDTPEESMKSRPPYNLMIGVTRDEMAFFSFVEMGETKPVLIVSEDLYFNDTSFTFLYPLCKYYKYPELVSFASRYHYSRVDVGQRTAGLSDEYSWIQKNSDLASAPMFWVPAYTDAMEALKTNSKVYTYSWDWLDAMEFYRNDSEFHYKGAVHTSELIYLFDTSEAEIMAVISMKPIDPKNSKRDKTHDAIARNLMGTLWTNFAKFGNPTPDASAAGTIWKPYNEKDQNYLSINFPNSKMQNDFYKDDAEFWNNYLPNLENSLQC